MLYRDVRKKILLPGPLPPDSPPTDMIIARIIALAEVMAGLNFYEYQKDFLWHYFQAVLEHEGAILTALFARQCLPGDAIIQERDGRCMKIRNHPRAWQTGVRDIYEVKVRGGGVLRCTDNHPIMRPDGTFTELRNLEVDDMVMCLKEASRKEPLTGKPHTTTCEDRTEADMLLNLWSRHGYACTLDGDTVLVLPEQHEETLQVSIDGEILVGRPIESISLICRDEVWDVRYPEKDWFISGGVCVHNSGKSECVADGNGALALALPFLAKQFPLDWRFNLTDEQGNYRGFKHGINIGIYAPKREQAQITLEKLRSQFSTKVSEQVMEEMGVTWEVSNGATVGLSNGSAIRAISASPQSHIEGASHHILLLEECQDMDTRVIEKSLSPMLSSTNGIQVMIGTASFGKSKFYNTIRENMRHDALHNTRTHFYFPAEICMRYNSMYRKYVEREKMRLGEDSDAYVTSYKCQFVLERGMFITEQMLFDEEIAMGDMLPKFPEFNKVYAGGADQPPRKYDLVAGIDFAKYKDSTVVTILAVEFDNPVIDRWVQTPDGNDVHYLAYMRHIVGWKILQNVDYETQYYEISNYLRQWTNLRRIAVDATGLGQVMYDRFVASMEGYVEVQGVVFSSQSNSDMYKFLAAELSAKRITFPYSDSAKKTKEVNRFVAEMLDAEKSYKDGGKLVVAAPNEADAHDDMVDSLCLAVHATKEPPGAGVIAVDESAYYFLGR